MHLPATLYARNLTVQRNVPFKEALPLKLKQRVSGKGDNLTEVCCLYEMSVMFVCLKENDFLQAPCTREIENFQKCYVTSMKDKNVRKEREARGILMPGEKKLSHKQLKNLMKRFPMEK